MMNTLDYKYQSILQDILLDGKEKTDRTGTGTISVFGKQIRHDMSEGFPLLTTKKMAIKSIMTELKWFLKGDTNIKFLVDNGCNIWNGDAYKNYRMKQVPHDHFETEDEFIELIKTNDRFAEKWGELGPIYGKQWRDINGIDQLENLIVGLINNPDGRRHIVNSWNVTELNEMVLPPCHYSFQCYVNDGKLSLMWQQRSVDVFLGLPFNIASYATLLLLLCKETKFKPGELIGNLGDTHLYKNHLEQAKEQVQRGSFKLPSINLTCYDIYRGDFEYEIIDYKHHPAIKAPLSN